MLFFGGNGTPPGFPTASMVDATFSYTPPRTLYLYLKP